MAETVYKAKKPFKQNGKHYYPITTHDQIIMPDGNRWDGQHLSSDVRDDAVEVGSIKVNADLLGGKLPEYYKDANTLGSIAAKDYALKTDTAPDSSKLGGVAASDYALKTDTAPDSSKLGGKAPEYYLQPRNLLDNSDFRNPVNQRGIYSAVNGQYIIDRWLFANSNFTGNVTITQSANGITITNDAGADTIAIIQRFIDKNYYNGKYTHAAKTTDGLVFGYTEVTDSENSIIQTSIWIPTGATVVWAALYEGTYTADTLPPYVPKGYAAELAECQRYYLPISDYWNMGVILTGTGYICLNVPTNIKMRITPNSIISGAKAYHPTYDWFDLTYRTIEWHSPFYRIIFNWPSNIQASISDIVLINGVTGLSADL